jgi:dTDP-4-dehydrorhamnose 3,5-epimerase
MAFIQTKMQDLVIFEPEIISDERGYFFETYNQKLFADNGIKANFVQDNESFSVYGTIRGLHFQKGKAAQAKLVRVTQGEVMDIVVDLRKESKTFGQTFSIILSHENKKQLFIPRGFAHGFSVLSNVAIFAYRCDNFFDEKSQSGIIYDDLDLDIDWQVDIDKILVSKKDLYLKNFKEVINE